MFDSNQNLLKIKQLMYMNMINGLGTNKLKNSAYLFTLQKFFVFSEQNWPRVFNSV